MSRPKFIAGNLYLVHEYERKKAKREYDGAVPTTKIENSYVVRFKRNDSSSLTGSGRCVTILAAFKKEWKWFGIPEIRWKFGSQDYEHLEFERVLCVGKDKQSDCMSFRKFSLDDVPLCVGWEFISNDLMETLKVA